MPVPLTRLSAVEYDNILHGQMTPSMAVRYLREGRIPLRSFAETLRGMYPAPDLAERLVDFYLQEEPGANHESVGRRVRNWLAGRNLPTAREDFYRIAFALGLEESQLNYLLGAFTGYGVQYRTGCDDGGTCQGIPVGSQEFTHRVVTFGREDGHQVHRHVECQEQDKKKTGEAHHHLFPD